MTTTTDFTAAIKSQVATYLQRYPSERGALGRLIDQIESGGDLVGRDNMIGHCTSSVLVLNRAMTHALFIHHGAYNTWIPAGGHFEWECANLKESAWREVAEETGLTDLQDLPGLADFILDIDTHPIPARPSKGEGPHFHHDFMFLGVAASDFTPVAQASEVHGVAWRALVDMENDPVPRNRKLYAKLRALQKQPLVPILSADLPVENVAQFVMAFAALHGVRAVRTKLDEFAEAVTRLSGDGVRLDDVEQMIVALYEKSLVTGDQMTRLAFNYIRERKKIQQASSASSGLH